MKHLRYMGEFLSRKGVIWRVEIMQEAEAEFSAVGQLSFPADSPLVIEWQREDKHVPILGSTATLKLISPGDRTYEDLYTIEVGSIRLDVYRDNLLYWSGALDPEFYEEPYQAASGYEVSLTFSDFGILDRLKYDLTGMQGIYGIVEYCIQRATILHSGINTQYTTTETADGVAAIDDLSVRSENFTDEEGEQSTLYDVLEGILQPLALRIVQRAGTIYLYDLHGLHTLATPQQVQWDGSSQTMGTDMVVNNVVVTFSPYSSAELMSGEVEYGGKYDVEHINLTSSFTDPVGEYGEYYSYYPDRSDATMSAGGSWDYDLVDFTIFLHSEGKGLAGIGSGCKYFHILPLTGGAEETTGVAYAFRTYENWILHNGLMRANTETPTAAMLTTERVFLPKLDTATAAKYWVRLVQEMLIDARYNPLSGSTEGNGESNAEKLKIYSGFVFIPAKVTLYDADGNALYHYSNNRIAKFAPFGGICCLGYTKGEWVAGADTAGDCWLEYYDPEDLQNSAGVGGGWKGNRHCIGKPDEVLQAGKLREPAKIYKSFAQMDDGEYMPYPPEGGYLEVQVLKGVFGHDYHEFTWMGEPNSSWDERGFYHDVARWCLYKAPRIDVVKNNLVFDNAELEDVEYSGYINKAAKEDLSIDTICGTADTVCPTAKGCYHRTSTGEQVQQLSRGDYTDHPEKLLIGTLYSQYAERKTTLSGEAVIYGGLHSYTEQNQPGKLFMLMADVQDVITDCTEAEYCEFNPDQYDGIEEIE